MHRWVGTRPTTQVTANDLLTRSRDHTAVARTDRGRTAVSVEDLSVPAELLADLHHPFLIITPDYVGPPRRVPSIQTRRWVDAGSECSGLQRNQGRRRGRRRATPVRPVIAAVALTAATVAPLTLAVAHGLGH